MLPGESPEEREPEPEPVESEWTGYMSRGSHSLRQWWRKGEPGLLLLLDGGDGEEGAGREGVVLTREEVGGSG